MQKIELKGKTVLVTGAAGFIGSNLVIELFKTIEDINIVGIDNMNDYYDVAIKEWRLSEIEKMNGKWTFIKGDISDKSMIDELFIKYKPAVVVNLAAQAGVRYSITNPDAYIQSNLIGFYNILEALTITVKQVLNILYMPQARPYMEQIRKFLIALTIRLIIRSVCMLQQRRVMN